MVSYCSLRKTTTVLFLSSLLFSCQARVTKQGEQAQTQTAKPNSQQTIVYGELVIKEQSNYILIPVGLSEDKNQNKNLLSSSRYDSNGTIVSNIIFYSKPEGKAHLLLDTKAIISSFDLLEIKAKEKPSTQVWLYRIIENDTNGDKELTSEDAIIGYLSDESGKNLQPITPNNTQMLSWSVVQSIGAIFIKIARDSDNDQKFTERDEKTFIRVNLDKPSIGTEIINDEIKQKLKSITLK